METREAYDPSQARQGRPKGISVLAILHVGGGIVGLLLVPVLLFQFLTGRGLALGANQLGLSPSLLILAYLFLFSLATLSGIGMWRGTWWGWHLGSFYYLYGLARAGGALVHLPDIFGAIPPEAIEDLKKGPEFYAIKYGGRAVIHSLIYLYFFRAHVRKFFGVSAMRRWNPFLTHTAIYLIVMTIRNLL